MKKIITAIFLLAGSSVCNVQAQIVKPGSISAAMADQKGASAVDYSTGTMNYNIPFFNIEQDGYKIPVSLMYSGKGIKVNEKSGLFGVGWTLSYGGGIITRTMRGNAADESRMYGILQNPIPAAGTPAYETFKKNVNAGKTDGESDIFQLNINGSTIRFILKKTGETIYAEPLERTNTKIALTVVWGDKITNWTITDGNGNEYEFAAANPSSALVKTPVPTASYIENMITTWYVTSIKPFNNDRIYFEYDNQEYAEIYRERGMSYAYYPQKMVFPDIGNTNQLEAQLQAAIAQNQMNAQIASAIRSQISDLTFNMMHDMSSVSDRTPFSAERAFMNASIFQRYSAEISERNRAIEHISFSGDNGAGGIQQALADMMSRTREVKSEVKASGQVNMFANKLIRKIILRNTVLTFDYIRMQKLDDYFYVLSNITYRTLSGDIIKKVAFAINEAGYLKSVQLASPKQTVEKEYTFGYYNEDENIHEFAVDYWGYYNGKVDNWTFLPLDPFYMVFKEGGTGYSTVFGRQGETVLTGGYADSENNGFGAPANRKPDGTVAMARSLRSVTDQMGGKTSFEYEGNEVYSQELSQNVPIGGVRIKKITSEDGLGNSISSSYKYKFPLLTDAQKTRSTGRLLEWRKKNFLWEYTYGSGGDAYVFSQPYDLGAIYDENSNNGLLYHYVEEVHPDNSITGYKYMAVDASESAGIHNGLLDGKLTAKILYDASGKIVNLERYTYGINRDIPDNRRQERNNDAGTFKYRVRDNAPPATIIRQVKKEPIYFEAEAIKAQFPNQVSYLTHIGNTSYGVNPYYSIYMPNYAPRVNHVLADREYLIHTGGTANVVATEIYTFGDYNTTTAYAAGNLTYPTEERAYLYDRLLNATGIPFLRQETSVFYPPSHDNPIRIVTADSKGNKLLTRIKYAQDYTAAAGTVLKALQDSNCANTIVEQQQWISSDNGSTYKLQESVVNDFVTKQGTTITGIFPEKKYMIQATTPINIVTAGFAENVGTLPPYSSLFWENKQLFKQDATNEWKLFSNFSKQVGMANKGDYTPLSTAFDNLSGNLLLEATGVPGRQITALDVQPLLTHPDYASTGKFTRPQLRSNGPQNFTFAQRPFRNNLGINPEIMDHSSFSAQILAMMENFEVTHGDTHSDAFATPYYQALREILTNIADKRPLNDFIVSYKNYDNEFFNNADSWRWPVYSMIPDGFDLEEILSYMGHIISACEGGDNFDKYTSLVLSSNPYVVTDANGQVAASPIQVDELITAGKNLEVYLVVYPNTPNTAVGYKIRYKNGTLSPIRLISPTAINRRIRKGLLQLNTLPDYQNAKELIFNTYSSSVYVVPENTSFTGYAYLPDNQQLLTFDRFGRFNESVYDEFGQRSYVKNERENIVRMDAVVYAKQPQYIQNTIPLKVYNRYPRYTTGGPIIKRLEFYKRFSLDVYPQESIVVPGQHVFTEIPVGSYEFYIECDHPIQQIKVNGVATAVSGNNFSIVQDLTPGTELKIEIMPSYML